MIRFLQCVVLPCFSYYPQIITNMSAVTSRDGSWSHTATCRHLLPLSISSQSSRLMELLIGETGVSWKRDVWGVDPALICSCSYRRPPRSTQTLLIRFPLHFISDSKCAVKNEAVILYKKNRTAFGGTSTFVIRRSLIRIILSCYVSIRVRVP